MRNFLFLLLLLLPITLLSAERKFEKSFTVEQGGKLNVNTDCGDVQIGGSSTGEVSIVAVLKGSLKDIDDFEISANQSGSVVDVLGKGRNGDWWSFGFDNLSVEYTIIIPEKFGIDVTTAGGDIDIQQVNGAIQGETSGGDVRIRNVRGETKLETSGGDVTAADVLGDFRAETSGGDIEVVGVMGDVYAETSGGDIRIREVRGAVKAETSGGDIIVTLSGENKGVMASTSGGDIDILTSESIKANLDASTSGGSVVCRLPITLSGEIDESHVRGTINGGGEVIRAWTSGGDVTIKKSE